MAKTPGKALLTGPACEPFRKHLARLRDVPPVEASSWTTVEAGFLDAMQRFDDSVTAGTATDGERQNGKGDYFNDLLAVVLENATGVSLDRRSGVKGLIFPNHNLDVTFPPSGDVIEVLVEAKMLGTPVHPGNISTQKAVGRPGGADFLKRCKEAGFKTIDLKAAYGMYQSAAGTAQQEGITGDLTSWLRTAKPKSYLVAAVRVVSDQDAKAVTAMANAMTQVMDGVGLYLYRPRGYSETSLSPALYEAVPGVPSSLELFRVLQRIGMDLRAAQTRISAAGPEHLDGPPLPSEAMQEALDLVDVEVADDEM